MGISSSGPLTEIRVSSGSPSPPLSPPLAADVANDELFQTGKASNSRTRGAAYTITEECERLFCETLRTIFLGERKMMLQDSLVKDTQELPLTSSTKSTTSLVSDWMEMWDYVGGLRFRGFVTGHGDQRSLFAFFDDAVMGKDLKPGYALIPGLFLTLALHSSSPLTHVG